MRRECVLDAQAVAPPVNFLSLKSFIGPLLPKMLARPLELHLSEIQPLQHVCAENTFSLRRPYAWQEVMCP